MNVLVLLLSAFLKNTDIVRLIIDIFTIFDIAIYAAIPKVNINRFSILDLLLIEYIADIDMLREANKYINIEYSKLIDLYAYSIMRPDLVKRGCEFFKAL